MQHYLANKNSQRQLKIAEEMPKPKALVAIDPGHGGIDGGTVDENGTLEKDLVLNIALQIKSLLEVKEHTVKTILTRETDRDLSALNDEHWKRQRRDLNGRIKIAQEENADFLVSIHINASKNKELRGPIVFYQEESTKSLKLAKIIGKNLGAIQEIAPQILPGNLYLLRRSDLPAVLVEIGFLTNPDDKAMIMEDTYQKKVAQSISESIIEMVKFSF